MKKNFLLVLMLCLSSFLPLRAESCLIVQLRNGNTESFLLSQKPEITFNEGEMQIRSTQAEAAFSITEILDFHFADETAGIPEIEANEQRITIAHGIVNIDGVNGQVSLCDISGKMLLTYPAQGNAHLDLNQFPKGVYLLSVGHKTIKLFNH